MRSVAFASGLVLASASWEEYKATYGKVYNGDDEQEHRNAYETNMAINAQQNALDNGLTYGVNQFTDLTQEQFRAVAGLGYKPSNKKWGALPHLGVHTHNGEKLADSVDWTTRGAVTPVKDQGQCGSCWAFSTTGGLEGSWQLATGQLTSMSEQFLVDCSNDGQTEAGCNGGSMEGGFAFVQNRGIATEASYPYKATDGSCQAGYQTAIPEGGISGYKTVGQDINDFKSAIANGPVSIAIEADQYAFQAYSGGILTSKGGWFSSCGTRLDHGVLAVGYADDFVKVKNSWGAGWGVDGFIKLSTSGNTCGMFSDASYPVVSGSVAV